MISIPIIVAVAIIIWLVIYLHRRATLYYAFEDLAKRYLGKVFTTLGGSPGANFRYRDVLVRLTAALRFPRNGGRQTRLALDWPDRRFQLVVYRRGTRFRGWSHSGLSAFRSDQPALHEQFEIWTNDTAISQGLLSPACVWHLFQLSELATNRHVLWYIRRGKCQIHIGGHFRRKKILPDVVAKMLELYSQALLTQQQGLDFVDERSPRVIEEMICPICSATIGRDVVICVRCRAPHCRECWQYNGKCATFGCGAEKCIAPVVDQPTHRNGWA